MADFEELEAVARSLDAYAAKCSPLYSQFAKDLEGFALRVRVAYRHEGVVVEERMSTMRDALKECIEALEASGCSALTQIQRDCALSAARKALEEPKESAR